MFPEPPRPVRLAPEAASTGDTPPPHRDLPAALDAPWSTRLAILPSAPASTPAPAGSRHSVPSADLAPRSPSPRNSPGGTRLGRDRRLAAAGGSAPTPPARLATTGRWPAGSQTRRYRW